jgi:hypothetical protein
MYMNTGCRSLTAIRPTAPKSDNSVAKSTVRVWWIEELVVWLSPGLLWMYAAVSLRVMSENMSAYNMISGAGDAEGVTYPMEMTTHV